MVRSQWVSIKCPVSYIKLDIKEGQRVPTKSCTVHFDAVSLLTIRMRGFVVSILFILISAQVEAANCPHFGDYQSSKSVSSYSKNDPDCSEKGLNDLPMSKVCSSCGHCHLVLFQDGISSIKFLNDDKKLFDFQNQSIDSRSVQPPIDPPRAQLA